MKDLDNRYSPKWTLAIFLTTCASIFYSLLFLASISNGDQQGASKSLKIVAIGDLHGDYPAFDRVLRLAKLIGENGEWIGGNRHLVICGDVLDRAPKTLE